MRVAVAVAGIEPDLAQGLATTIARVPGGRRRCRASPAPRRRSGRTDRRGLRLPIGVLEDDLHLAAQRPQLAAGRALDRPCRRSRSRPGWRAAAAAPGRAWSCRSRSRRPRRPSGPRAPSSVDAVHRLDVADRAAQQAALDREPCTFTSSRRHHDRRVWRRRRRLALGLGRQQMARIGMLRAGEDLGRPSPCSTISPSAHHADAVGHAADDAEIVGDQQHRHAEPAPAAPSAAPGSAPGW